MKVFLVLIVATFSCTTLSSQTMDNFFKYEGVAYIAGLAHPLSTYRSGRYTVYSNKVLIEIQYEEGTTHLTLYRRGDLFIGIEVTKDIFFWPAFSVSEAIKDLLLLAFQEDEQNKGIASAFEKYFNKTMYNMTGAEMAIVLMTIAWIGY